jgi:thiol-disulfide isomerase/thioredoxin
MTRLLTRTAFAAVLLAATVASAAAPLDEAHSRDDVAKHFDRSASVRVLTIWATWCAPCVAEMPEMQRIHESYRDRGVSLVALSMDDALPGSRDEARKRVEAFVSSRSLTFPNLLYVGAVTDIETELDLDGEIPVTILFDRNGRELQRIVGMVDATAFRAELDRLLTRDARASR